MQASVLFRNLYLFILIHRMQTKPSNLGKSSHPKVASVRGYMDWLLLGDSDNSFEEALVGNCEVPAEETSNPITTETYTALSLLSNKSVRHLVVNNTELLSCTANSTLKRESELLVWTKPTERHLNVINKSQVYNTELISTKPIITPNINQTYIKNQTLILIKATNSRSEPTVRNVTEASLSYSVKDESSKSQKKKKRKKIKMRKKKFRRKGEPDLDLEIENLETEIAKCENKARTQIAALISDKKAVSATQVLANGEKDFMYKMSELNGESLPNSTASETNSSSVVRLRPVLNFTLLSPDNAISNKSGPSEGNRSTIGGKQNDVKVTNMRVDVNQISSKNVKDVPLMRVEHQLIRNQNASLSDQNRAHLDINDTILRNDGNVADKTFDRILYDSTPLTPQTLKQTESSTPSIVTNNLVTNLNRFTKDSTTSSLTTLANTGPVVYNNTLNDTKLAVGESEEYIEIASEKTTKKKKKKKKKKRNRKRIIIIRSMSTQPTLVDESEEYASYTQTTSNNGLTASTIATETEKFYQTIGHTNEISSPSVRTNQTDHIISEQRNITHNSMKESEKISDDYYDSNDNLIDDDNSNHTTTTDSLLTGFDTVDELKQNSGLTNNINNDENQANKQFEINFHNQFSQNFQNQNQFSQNFQNQNQFSQNFQNQNQFSQNFQNQNQNVLPEIHNQMDDDIYQNKANPPENNNDKEVDQHIKISLDSIKERFKKFIKNRSAAGISVSNVTDNVNNVETYAPTTKQMPIITTRPEILLPKKDEIPPLTVKPVKFDNKVPIKFNKFNKLKFHLNGAKNMWNGW